MSSSSTGGLEPAREFVCAPVHDNESKEDAWILVRLRPDFLLNLQMSFYQSSYSSSSWSSLLEFVIDFLQGLEYYDDCRACLYSSRSR